MKNVPFEAAKEFCKKYEKDQVIILSWDKNSGSTWVTTFGAGDKNSIQAANAGNQLKDYLKLKRENDEIPERFKEWYIDRIETYYFWSGRNSRTFEEITFWYESHSKEKNETKRSVTIYPGDDHSLPDWAKPITEHKKRLDYDS